MPTGKIVSMRPGLSVLAVLLCFLLPACTVYRDHPPRVFADATGGEDLEQVFWKHIKAGNWVEVERALASNYVGLTPAGPLDRTTTLDRYRKWKLKHYALGDLKTELNGSTIVVTYTISLSGTAGEQALPSAPQHMMSVWQQQKAGWVQIAHSVTQP